jgi:uridylate kinase
MFIIKLGGSLIQKSLTEVNPDIPRLIHALQENKLHCAIAVGGGKSCRLFQRSLKEQGVEQELLDQMGIAAVNFNAQYVRGLFTQSVYPNILSTRKLLHDAITHRDDFKHFVCGAWETGHSSDNDAVEMALQFGVKKIIRLSDVDAVYESDPDKNPDAKPLETLNWEEYLNIIGNPVWSPGASFPVDPVAARRAKQEGLEFYFVTLENLIKYPSEDVEKLAGTIISGCDNN